MDLQTSRTLIILGGFALLAFFAWLMLRDSDRPLRPGMNIVTKADAEKEEPDEVELPDHRILDRELAHLIGTSRWGESLRRQYREEDYRGEIRCLSCKRPILPGQWFWETPLFSKQTNLPLVRSFYSCFSCQPGDAEAVTRGQ